MKNDKRQKPKAETAGFTLVEIVAVLVLLGILAAVAVPKFFDLSSDAEKKAAEAALMEAQVRINAGYSKAVYAGSTCEAAVKKVNTLALIGDAGTNKIGKFEFKLESGDEIAVAPGTYVTLTATDSKRGYEKLGQLFVPTCDGQDTEGEKPESGLTCPDVAKPQDCASTTVTCSSGTCDCTCYCKADGSSECTCQSGGGNGGTTPDPNNPSDNGSIGDKCDYSPVFKEDSLNYFISGCLNQDIPRYNLKYKDGSVVRIGKYLYVSVNSQPLSKDVIEAIYNGTGFESGFIMLDELNIVIENSSGGWAPQPKTGSITFYNGNWYMYKIDYISADKPDNSNRWVKLIRKTIDNFDGNEEAVGANHCEYDETGVVVCVKSKYYN